MYPSPVCGPLGLSACVCEDMNFQDTVRQRSPELLVFLLVLVVLLLL